MLQINRMIRITIVWLVLMLATGVSWFLGSHHQPDGQESLASTITIIVVAMFKVRLVIMHFMEIGNAPLALRLLCEAWVVLIGAGMIFLCS